MEMSQAVSQRYAWGTRPCDHIRLEREFYNGTATGDYVCAQCGHSFTKQEVTGMHSLQLNEALGDGVADSAADVNAAV